MLSFCLMFVLKLYLYVINCKSKGCLRFSESWGTSPCVPSNKLGQIFDYSVKKAYLCSNLYQIRLSTNLIDKLT